MPFIFLETSLSEAVFRREWLGSLWDLFLSSRALLWVG